MKKRIVFRREFGVVSALWTDGKVEQIDVDALPPGENRLGGRGETEEAQDAARGDLLGTIHVGRVRNIVKNIKAAFVEVADGQMCYYSLEQNPLPVFVKAANGKQVCQDDEIVVQITRAGVKSKEPVAESELSLNGRYIVLIRGKRGISFSKKIADEAWKEQALEALRPYLHRGAGVIVRTNAREAPLSVLEQEMKSLYETYDRILKTAMYRSGRSLLYAPDPDYLRTLRDTVQEGLSEIVTNDIGLHGQIADYWKQYEGESQVKITYYQEENSIPMGQAYAVDRTFREALAERVWLKSGAYLVIQPTEALTVVDVNSGKAVAGKPSMKKSVDEAFYKINLEAARETMRQLRLRNLSGIILVDFINMQEQVWRERLMEELRGLAGRDPVRTMVVDMTKLNLVEITRKKIKRPLGEWVYGSRERAGWGIRNDAEG